MIWTATLCLLLSSLAVPAASQESDELPRLSPEHWDAGERQRWLDAVAEFGRPKPEASGTEGMVVGTTGPFAVYAGTKALQAGGSAMDAALTTALAEIVLSAGSWNSFAGITSILWYDAASGEVFALDGSYTVPVEETQPLTIPAGEASGRTALVPGVPGAFDAARARFGRLPMRELAAPAIWLCEEGFPVYPFLAGMFQYRAEVLSRRPDTRATFANQDGDFPGVGERLRQPALARTLRRYAEEGAEGLLTGEWGRRFVEAVREEGGRLSAEDLATSRPLWTEPLRTSFRGHEVFAPGLPTFGGVQMLEALAFVETAGLAEDGADLQSAETLYWLMQCTRTGHLLNYTPEAFGAAFAGLREDPGRRVSRDHADMLWALLKAVADQRGGPEEGGREPPRPGGHSDAVVAADAEGNVCAMIHTINTSTWGTTGIFVDGVSIPDSAGSQQLKIAAVGPGGRVPSEMNPVLVLQDGLPVLASSCIGGGLIETSVQAILRSLLQDAGPREAAEGAHFGGPVWTPAADGSSRFQLQAVEQGRFPDELLDAVRARGQEVLELPAVQMGSFEGWWIGVRFAPDGSTSGGVPPTHNGRAMGLGG